MMYLSGQRVRFEGWLRVLIVTTELGGRRKGCESLSGPKYRLMGRPNMCQHPCVVLLPPACLFVHAFMASHAPQICADADAPANLASFGDLTMNCSRELAHSSGAVGAHLVS